MKTIALVLICSAGFLTGCASNQFASRVPHDPAKSLTSSAEPGWTVVPAGERF